MAAKLVVLALAFCSASAGVCIFPPKDGCQGLSDVFGPPPMAVAGPRMVQTPAFPLVPSGVVSAPGPVVSVSGPNFGFPQDFTDASPEIAPGSFGPVPSGPVGVPRPLPVVQAPPVTLNPVESPIISLPSPAIPGPQVIRHKCFCTKTIVRPQIIQRTINVPRIQRYLKRTYRPVVENVAYTAKPVGGDSQGQDIVIGGVPSAGPVSVVQGGVISGGVIPGGVFQDGGFPGGVVSDGAFPAGVINGGVIQGGVISGVSGGPYLEASETTCEQVVPSFPRCY